MVICPVMSIAKVPGPENQALAAFAGWPENWAGGDVVWRLSQQLGGVAILLLVS